MGVTIGVALLQECVCSLLWFYHRLNVDYLKPKEDATTDGEDACGPGKDIKEDFGRTDHYHGRSPRVPDRGEIGWLLPVMSIVALFYLCA